MDLKDNRQTITIPSPEGDYRARLAAGQASALMRPKVDTEGKVLLEELLKLITENQIPMNIQERFRM